MSCGRLRRRRRLGKCCGASSRPLQRSSRVQNRRTRDAQHRYVRPLQPAARVPQLGQRGGLARVGAASRTRPLAPKQLPARVSPAALRRARRQRACLCGRTACAPPPPSPRPTTLPPLCPVSPAPPPAARAAARSPPRSCAAPRSDAGAQPRSRAGHALGSPRPGGGKVLETTAAFGGAQRRIVCRATARVAQRLIRALHQLEVGAVGRGGVHLQVRVRCFGAYPERGFDLRRAGVRRHLQHLVKGGRRRHAALRRSGARERRQLVIAAAARSALRGAPPRPATPHALRCSAHVRERRDAEQEACVV